MFKKKKSITVHKSKTSYLFTDNTLRGMVGMAIDTVNATGK